ncbi:15878_t:CDS:2, partial [Dentiscutata erythropus]
MDYSLTTPTPTTLTTQSQQSGQNTIPPENNKPIRAPVPIPARLSGPENTLTTELNPLMADNLALLPDSTANSYQDLPMDTHSNTTIESLPKRSYATALTVLKDLATQCTDEFDKLKWHNDYIISAFENITKLQEFFSYFNLCLRLSSKPLPSSPCGIIDNI